MFFSGFMACAWPDLQEVKQCHEAAVGQRKPRSDTCLPCDREIKIGVMRLSSLIHHRCVLFPNACSRLILSSSITD